MTLLTSSTEKLQIGSVASYLCLARCDHGDCVLKAVLRYGKDLRRPVDFLFLAVATNQLHGNSVLKAVLRSGKDLRRPVDSLFLAVATNQRHGNCVLKAGLRAGDDLQRSVDSLFLAVDHSFLEFPV